VLQIEVRYYFLTLLSPSQRYQAANGSPQLALFFDRLFSLLNFFHATNHERRKIALHNCSLPAFSLQNLCRAISACRFCAASLYSGLIPETALSSEKAKVEKNTAIKTRKLTRLKLLLLFLCLQH
jgi:hypothetical protein